MSYGQNPNINLGDLMQQRAFVPATPALRYRFMVNEWDGCAYLVEEANVETFEVLHRTHSVEALEELFGKNRVEDIAEYTFTNPELKK